MTDILVITAHPQMAHSRATRELMLAAAKLPNDRVHVRDLYALYPDYLIDIKTEQSCLSRASLVVWLQPIYWYGMPPLLKLWLDEVFSFGWAYGTGGKALQGKYLWLVASTGGDAQSYCATGYNQFAFDAFLPPYQQTAALTGMHWLPPLVLHGAHQISEAQLQAHSKVLVQKLQSWPAWAQPNEDHPHSSARTDPALGPPAKVAVATDAVIVPSAARPRP